jgi:hypothetical protein
MYNQAAECHQQQPLQIQLGPELVGCAHDNAVPATEAEAMQQEPFEVTVL